MNETAVRRLTSCVQVLRNIRVCRCTELIRIGTEVKDLLFTDEILTYSSILSTTTYQLRKSRQLDERQR
jgi:hypothetical protein